MALALPRSTFVGIDLSGEQIAQGHKTIAALGLDNIDLRHQSILDIDARLGSFDYVICHGVYSWVPAEVQEKVLDVCARHLRPDGVGYVSYNTYPGWHLRAAIRDMMTYHVSRSPDDPPERRVGRARALLDFLARSARPGDGPYALLLRQHRELLRQHSDAYLFHEHLEERNEPLYFLQFCERLSAHGLRYLGEAEFNTMVTATAFPSEVQRELEGLAPNLLEREQYTDFLRNRTFRQTLVCHDHVRPIYEVRAERLAAFHVASPLRPRSAAPDLTGQAAEEFFTEGGLTLTNARPIVKAALACLGEHWPRAVPFAALLARARARLGAAADDPASQDALDLGRALLTAYATAGEALVELSLCPAYFTTEVSECPVASPLARLQAVTGHQATNLRHAVVNLLPFHRHLLPLLDGSRARTALVPALVERVRQGAMHVTRDDQPVTDSARAGEILGEVLDQELPRLAKTALLIA